MTFKEFERQALEQENIEYVKLTDEKPLSSKSAGKRNKTGRLVYVKFKDRSGLYGFDCSYGKILEVLKTM